MRPFFNMSLINHKVIYRIQIIHLRVSTITHTIGWSHIQSLPKSYVIGSKRAAISSNNIRDSFTNIRELGHIVPQNESK